MLYFSYRIVNGRGAVHTVLGEMIEHVFLYLGERGVVLVYQSKRHWELRAIIAEALSVCGISPACLEELIAIERTMPHTVVSVIAATVLATERETMRNENLTN